MGRSTNDRQIILPLVEDEYPTIIQVNQILGKSWHPIYHKLLRIQFPANKQALRIPEEKDWPNTTKCTPINRRIRIHTPNHFKLKGTMSTIRLSLSLSRSPSDMNHSYPTVNMPPMSPYALTLIQRPIHPLDRLCPTDQRSCIQQTTHI